MNIKRTIFYVFIMSFPVIVITVYIFLLPDALLLWKENTGEFGDSFGVINVLFTGLAFSGLIVAILQQQEEIKIQRDANKKAEEIQNNAIKISAYSELLKEYNGQIQALQILISEATLNREKGITGAARIRSALNNKPPYKHPQAGKLDKLIEKNKRY
ncbi:hypothetical protein [Methylomonas sp. MgM2]